MPVLVKTALMPKNYRKEHWTEYNAWRSMRLGYASQGVIWEPGVNALDVAGKGGWTLSGVRINGGETVWSPDDWRKTSKTSKEVEADAWVKILESALSGCPVALQAMRDVVTTNDKYAEFKESLDVLSEDYDSTR